MMNPHGAQHAVDTSNLPIITQEELSQHNSDTDLWVSINGLVYDVTNFKHKAGRQVILQQAGSDISGSFNKFHGYLNPNGLPNVVLKGRFQPQSRQPLRPSAPKSSSTGGPPPRPPQISHPSNRRPPAEKPPASSPPQADESASDLPISLEDQSSKP
ncbi:putative Cytochrome b5-like Heme/Steroid binding domain containing protein [Blattamonas nauphoetae]|uniref:Cytochrome b5-like Heme/Steroid binding domain containing protein n=1 Tax=Blattamonas nauphoetae TaxID=2049346 RepID=A0ABQ9WQY5_9EUKA|nr:putative Cytochrome b5-like Heme/Steroid binding domain containing protein [Blattamonas nauphoetae]